MAGNQQMPALRISVVGPSGSGKTCLINSFINNTCPMVYTPTDDFTLYYRTLRAQDPDSNELVNVLLEVEDSYGSDRGSGANDKDKYGKPRRIAPWLKERDKDGATSAESGGTFGGMKGPTETEYRPITYRKMAFLVLYDVTDLNAFEGSKSGAKYIIDEIYKAATTKKCCLIYLVANKMDLDPLGESFALMQRKVQDLQHEIVRRLQGEGQEVAWPNQEKSFNPSKDVAFKVEWVSATEFTRVRKLFRTIVDDLMQRPQLWRPDDSADHASKTADNGKSIFGGGNWFGW